MGRSSRKQTDLHRESVVAHAGRLFRERGVEHGGIAEIMAAAGLTHGAFYSHFASKEQLAAAACTQAFAEVVETWRGLLEREQAPAEARRTAVDRYVSASHRDRPGSGCPSAAMAADAIRDGDGGALRGAYAAGIQAMAAALERMQPARLSAPRRRRRALASLAAMVGAITLARATRGEAFSDEMVDAVRAELLGD